MRFSPVVGYRVVGAGVLLAWLLSVRSAGGYYAPSVGTYDEVKNVAENELPSELQQANCGYRVPADENKKMTEVYGVPVKKTTWRGESTGGTPPEEYPSDAWGYVFANYSESPTCVAVGTDPHPCHSPTECEEKCAYYNIDHPTDPPPNIFRYRVQRLATCWCPLYIGGVPVDWIELPTEDISFDCNSCPWDCLEGSFVDVGEKYKCTGYYPEEVDGRLRVDYGWVWDPPPDISAEAWCEEYWRDGEDREYPNCMKRTCNGEECRTDFRCSDDTPNCLSGCIDGGCNERTSNCPDAGECTPSFPQGDPLFDPRNGSYYHAFFRHYVAWHKLKPLTEGGTKMKTDEEYDVNLGCYAWYKEPQEPTKGGDELNCTPDDLKIKEKLKKRQLQQSPEFNLSDNISSWSSNMGGFSLNPDNKTGSVLKSMTVTPHSARPPFGETSKYVTVMQEIEKKMEGYATTVQLLLPNISPSEELNSLFGSASSTSSTTPLVDLTVPLQPGLIEAVREVFRNSFFTRVIERPVPVVLPLVSDAEIQTSLQAWENWKTLREELGYDTDGADDIIDGLKEYRKLRNGLPDYITAVMEDRKKLSDAIDEWIESRMKPYKDALAEQTKQQELIDTWKKMKSTYGALGIMNNPYCKADATTPALEWMELDDIPFPDIPLFPLHLVFDFSDIFLVAANEMPSLEIPVLQPVNVAVKIPSPPPPTEEGSSAPDFVSLPSVPTLPDPPASKLKIKKMYGAEPSPPEFPYDKLKDQFDEINGVLQDVSGQYMTYLWVTKKNPNLECKTLGVYPCVYPETRLWDVFMRIWSPVGGFLNLQEPAVGAASSPRPYRPCDPKDDQCQLRELLIQRSLRITLPSSSSSGGFNSSIEQLRTQMRERTIEPAQGGFASSQKDFYDTSRPQHFYQIFPAPLDIPLEAMSSSSSS